MTSTAVDFEAIKDKQRAGWETGDYPRVGNTLQIIAELLAEAADVRTDQRVLDVACGQGNAALAAARRFADATGVDYAANLLAQGRERAVAEHLPVTFLKGDAEALPVLQAGRAAIVAGAVDAGLKCLRRAVAEAEQCQDPVLRGRALSALGSALVHAIRGRDEEGAIVLHAAIQVATEAGDRTTSVVAHRELGFVEVQAGRRSTAASWLVKALALAETDAEHAAILGVRGMNSSGLDDYPAAFERLGASVELAAACGDHRQQAWSLSIMGRAHLLRDDHSQARATVRQSLDLVRQERWIAFLP
ncbi:methyltransferase domain-containing protein [Kribbella sp. NPDC006257]|uniref:methyltransferase domain-containing protein n=1 Tax=Kribbella sp. NPDC006257 TaxID=3156738 RepID=UPI00339DCD99